MSTALVPAGAAGGFLAVAADDLAALTAFASDMSAGGGGIYLKHDGNEGEWSYGSNADLLADGTQLAFKATSLQRGYVCWKDEKVVDEIMKPFNQGAAPALHSLPDHGPYEEGDGWVEQSIIEFKMVDAPYLELTFKASGKTKNNAVGRLMKDFAALYKANFGLIPIVEIGNQSFVSKAKGARGATKHAPTLKIIDWAKPEDLIEAEEGSEADYAQDGAPAQELVEAPAAPAARTAPATGRPARAAAAQAAAPAQEAAPAAAPAGEPKRRGRFG